MTVGGGGLGIIVIALLIWALGGNPVSFLQNAGPMMSSGGSTSSQPITPEEEQLAAFVRVVLADTEDVWNRLMPELGRSYREPTLVLFSGLVDSACGRADASVGPFYCGADQQVYIDLAFYSQLKRDLGAPGDFAQAYVIAHEVGHHVQQLLGISPRVHEQQARLGGVEANRLSVRLELQADFLAGVWAHHADAMSEILEPGDVDEALNAASRIGDDVLQKRARGSVVPDAFTHGTAAQRVRWFRLGLETGDLSLMNTFDVPWDEL